jgi:hypothetical protein
MLVVPQKSTPPAIAHGWGFLDWWSFIGTIATLVGLILALYGLYIAVKQIKQTISAAIASANTARNMWQQQLGSRLIDLKKIRNRIENCAPTGNREEMRALLNEWMELASEVYGIIESVTFPVQNAGADLRSDLGLDDNDGTLTQSATPLYTQLATKLNGSMSATRTALSQVETARRNRILANLTRTCREKISEVIVESARFQVGLNAQMVFERAHSYGT